VTSPIADLVVNASRLTAWFVSGRTAHRVHLTDFGKVHSAELGTEQLWSGARIVAMDGSIVAASPRAADLKIVDEVMRVITVGTQYEGGFRAIAAVDDKLLCGICRSSTIRLVDVRGAEVAAFLGHTDTPIQIVVVSNEMFVSGGEDRAVKVWDVRQRVPVAHIGTNQAVMALAATTQFVAFAESDRQIGVVDVRGAARGPILGLSTESYVVSNMCYDEGKDVLRLFGKVVDEGDDGKVLAPYRDWKSRKYVFRRYSDFLRLGSGLGSVGENIDAA
jgi:hypothetical protein